MQLFVFILFILITLAQFVGDSIPSLRLFGYSPDLLSLLVLPYMVLEGIRRRFDLLAAKYCLAFGALALIAACGVVVNDVSAGPLLLSLRSYFRALPFFLLPIVADFSERQIGQQLRLLLALALLQFPVAIFQRWVVLSHERYSGDSVVGTLHDSGAMSIFLICAALVATGLYLRGRLQKRPFFILLFLLIFPTTINETKVTVFYVPLGFLITLLVGAERGHKAKVLGWCAAFMVIFVAVFVPVYNLMETYNPYKQEKDIVSFFGDQKQVSHYLYANAKGVGTKVQVRRGDSIVVPFSFLAKDPIRLALGLGVGNTLSSSLGPTYAGKYSNLFSSYMNLSLTSFLLEMGLLGVGALLVIYGLIASDSFAVARDDGLVGAIAIGWTGVTALMCISLIYTNTHIFDSLSYTFWYFSGMIAAQRVKLMARTSRATVQVGYRSSALR